MSDSQHSGSVDEIITYVQNGLSLTNVEARRLVEQLAIVEGNFHDAEKARIGLLEQYGTLRDAAEAVDRLGESAHYRARAMHSPGREFHDLHMVLQRGSNPAKRPT